MVVLVFTTLAVLVGPAAPACACSCALGTLEEFTEGADVVFAGTVREDGQPLWPGSSPGWVTATIRVTVVYKGASVRAWTDVETSGDGASCGYPLAEGHRYLIFANEWEGALRTGLCSGNRDLGEESNPFQTTGYAPIPGSEPGWWTAEKGVVAGATTGVAFLAVGWWLLARRRRRTAGQKSA